MMLLELTAYVAETVPQEPVTIFLMKIVAGQINTNKSLRHPDLPIDIKPPGQMKIPDTSCTKRVEMGGFEGE
jgi:hypothetical protein